MTSWKHAATCTPLQQSLRARGLALYLVSYAYMISYDALDRKTFPAHDSCPAHVFTSTHLCCGSWGSLVQYWASEVDDVFFVFLHVVTLLSWIVPS